MRVIKESVSIHEDALDEVRDILGDWDLSPQQLKRFHADIMEGYKDRRFLNIIEEISSNDSDAMSYYLNSCGGSTEDDLYDCEELDNDILDLIEEMM